MPIVQEAFYVPENIMTGLLSGRYRRIGGVVRIAAGPGKGQIVKHLDPVDLPESKAAESLAAKALRVVRSHKKAAVVTGIVLAAAGTGAVIYHKVKSQEPKVLKEFKVTLGKYISAIREGSMTLDLIAEMENALEALKADDNYENFVIQLKAEELEALVGTIHGYTIKLASDNGVEYDEAEGKSGNVVTDFESYLGIQKKVFEQAA